MMQSRQRRKGGISVLEAVLLAVAVAVLAVILIRVTGDRTASGTEPAGTPGRAAADRTPRTSESDLSPASERRGAPAADGSTANRSEVADASEAGDTPPLPPGFGEEDFLLPAAPRGAAPGGDGMEALDPAPGDEFLPEEEEVDEASITALDLFRDMLDDDSVSLADKKELVGDMGLEDIYEALDLVGTMEWGREAESLFSSIMNRWGKLDPQGAIEYASSLDSLRVRESAMSQVLKTWVRDDPEAAYAWFSGLPPEEVTSLRNGVRTLFKGMAAHDAMWAFQQVWGLDSRGAKTQALQSVLGELTAQGYEPDALVQLFQGMPPGTDRTLLAQTIVDQWTRYQPEAAARWIDTLTDDGSYKRAVDRLVTQWSRDDPTSAASWVEDLSDADLRRVQMGRLVQNWVRVDPGAASAWLTTFPPSTDLDPAIHSLAREVKKQDPATAFAWAEAVTHNGSRNRLLQEVGRAWLEQQPAQAANGIAGSSLPPKIKNKLLR